MVILNRLVSSAGRMHIFHFLISDYSAPVTCNYICMVSRDRTFSIPFVHLPSLTFKKLCEYLVLRWNPTMLF